MRSDSGVNGLASYPDLPPPAFATALRGRAVVLEGRLFNPDRADEVLVSPKFVASYGKGVGDMVTLHLASPRQMDAGFDRSSGPRGPKIRARIGGVIRTPWGLGADTPGQKGGVLASPALFAHYRANIIGTT